MPKKSLSELTWAAAREIAADIANRVKKGETLIRIDRVLLPRIANFTYNAGGGIGYSTSYESAEVRNPEMTRVTDAVTRLAESETIKRFQAEVTKSLGPGPIDYALAPSTFLMNCVIRCANQTQEGETSATDLERGLASYVSHYYSRVVGAPAEVVATVWLEGIWLKSESIELDDWLSLRRPSPDDLVSEMTGFRGMPTVGFYGPPPLTAAAAEISLRMRTPTALQEKIDLICNSLRLYQVCPVAAARTDFGGEGYFGGSHQWSNRPAFPGAKIPLGAEDAEPLRRVMGILEGSALIGPNSPTAENPVRIALARYSESLLGSNLPEAQITSAMTALEAMFLGTEERSEVTHRLSQRVSILFACLGDAPIEVYQKVSRAYDVRSKFIHGSGLEGPERKGIEKLVERILELTRASILVLTQVLAGETKDEFISRIDKAVLDPASRDKLKTVVEKCEASRHAG